MKIAEIKVAKTTCEATQLVPIPKGIVGATVSIEYMDSAWDGLQKTVVFRSAVTKDVLASGNEVVIPAEVVSRAGRNLYIGVYGMDAANNVVIPTIWAELGTILDAANPSGDTTTDPALPVWEQLHGMIGNLDELDTETKNDIVSAVNEALAKGVSVDESEIRRIMADYLSTNPPTVTETDPTVPPWAKQPQKPTYTATEVGADPAGTAASAVSQHNTDTAAHNDLRIAMQELANRVNAALDSDDVTLDQMSEVVAYIKSNKTLIDAITTSKVSVADIVNDLVTNVADKPLSAAQGVALKKLIDDLQAMIPEGGSGISVTGATVGQTVKIAAVDESGKPTAWEPADFPSGADEPTGVIELLVDHTITAEEASASSITFTKEKWPLIDGQKFVVVRVVKPTGVGGWWKLKAGNKIIISWAGNKQISQVGFAMVTNGIWLADSSEGGNMAGGPNLRPNIWVGYKAYYAIDPPSYDYYDSFTLYSFTAVWPEGTTIEIYGVK